MRNQDDLERRVDALQGTLTLRAKSLIVTVLGDVIDAHGGGLWLGNLIELAAPFGINERLVRTSVLRLSREDWLSARQIGRRSYYELTEAGRQRIRDSGRRIYAGPRTVWRVHPASAMVNASWFCPAALSLRRRHCCRWP